MKNGKNILIFVIINIIVISIAVILPMVPVYKLYGAYHYDMPKVGESSFSQNVGTVVKELDTQESKTAFNDAIIYGVNNRGDVFYDNFVVVYIMLGILLGISLISIGLILKYKCENKIYSNAFITAGVIVVIVYILILSILLQKNVYYSIS